MVRVGIRLRKNQRRKQNDQTTTYTWIDMGTSIEIPTTWKSSCVLSYMWS